MSEIDIAATLATLYEQRENSSEQITRLHLRAIALAVREAHPRATTFEMSWSDQGSDEWMFLAAHDQDGTTVTDDYDPLQEELDSFRLDGDQRDLWTPLTTDPQAFVNYERSPDVARFDIDGVLVATDVCAQGSTR